jgi:hypothetical protein
MAQGKGNSFITDLLTLIFNATAIASLAANAASNAATNLYISLHTAALSASSTQNTSEAVYTSYDRVAVARTSGGWTVSGQSVTPAATIIFPAATGGSETETYWAIGLAAHTPAAGYLLYFGTISPTIAVSNGVTPELSTASTVTEA